MKRYALFAISLFIIVHGSGAKEIKLSVIQCVYEQTCMNDPEIPAERDTITYVGVFGSIKDSVVIYNTKWDKVGIYMRKLSEDNYSLYFYENDNRIDKLQICCKDSMVYVDNDIYHLYPESYHRFKENVTILSLADMLGDCLGDYPKATLALLNLNWGIPFEKYRIDRANHQIQSPHSDLKYEYKTAYEYDDRLNVCTVIQKGRYLKKRVEQLSDSVSLYHIEYNYGDRETGELTYSRNKFGGDNIEGTWTQVPTANEYHYRISYARPVLYEVEETELVRLPEYFFRNI